MAARLDAAAAPGPKDGAFMSFNVVCSSPNSVNLPLTHKEKHIYDRRSLLDIGNAYKHQLSVKNFNPFTLFNLALLFKLYFSFRESYDLILR